MAWLGHTFAIAVLGPAPSIDAPPPRTRAADEVQLERARDEPPAPTLTPEIRKRGTGPRDAPSPPGLAPPGVLEDRSVSPIEVRFRPDGSVQVDVPRSLHARAAACALGRCIGRRGVKSGSKDPIPHATAPVVLGLSGTFGWLPASPRDATRLLEQTREQRIRLAIDAQRARLERASGEISVKLGKLLHDRSIDDARRREIVFALWDDAACAAIPPEVDEPLAAERASAAGDARARIEAFVRRWMPRSSKLGFTSSELAKLNAKRCSPTPFVPYGVE